MFDDCTILYDLRTWTSYKIMRKHANFTAEFEAIDI